LAGGKFFSCHRFLKLAKAATILRASMKFSRGLCLLSLVFASLYAGVSQAGAIQPPDAND